MALFKVSVKRPALLGNVRLEKGMEVNVTGPPMSNPLHNEGGIPTNDAFLRVYGIDMKKANALNTNFLEWVKIS
ncbi:DUF6140 family protein [Ancylomarina sp. YFZ004]